MVFDSMEIHMHTQPDVFEVAQRAVFVSYAREDLPLVRAFEAALQAVGVSAWVDVSSLDYASLWQREVEQAIVRSQLVVVLVSPAFIQSVPCRLEVEQAERLQKRLLPLILPSVSEGQVPEALKAFQWFVVQGDDQAGVASMVQAVQRSLKSDPEWLRRHADLTARAQQWKEVDQDPSLLLRGTELKAAQGLLQARPNERGLGADALALLTASSIAEGQRRRKLAINLSAVGVALSVLGAVAWNKHQQAQAQQMFALQSRVSQLVAVGDLKAVADIQSTEQLALSKNTMLARQVQVSLSDYLQPQLVQSSAQADWLARSGNTLVIGQGAHAQAWLDGATGEALLKDQWAQVTAQGAGFPDHEGQHWVQWNSKQFKVFDRRGHLVQQGLAESPIDHVSYFSEQGVAWVQHAQGVSIITLSAEQAIEAPKQLNGAELLFALSAECALLRKAAADGWAYSVVNGAGEYAELGVLPGALTQVMANRQGILALRLGKQVYGFERTNAQADEKQAWKSLGRHWVAETSGVNLAQEVPLLVVQEETGEARLAAFALDEAVSQLRKRLTDPASTAADAAERVWLVRRGATQANQLRPSFDADDTRAFVTGNVSRVISPIKASVVAQVLPAPQLDNRNPHLQMWVLPDGLWVWAVQANEAGLTLTQYALPKRDLRAVGSTQTERPGWLNSELTLHTQRRAGGQYDVYSTDTQTQWGSVSGHQGEVTVLHARPKGNVLLTADAAGTLQLWEWSALRRIKAFEKPGCNITAAQTDEALTQARVQCSDGRQLTWAIR